MYTDRARILMHGPGGPNMQLWLDFFQEHADRYDVTLICPRLFDDRPSSGAYPDLRIHEYARKLPFPMNIRPLSSLCYRHARMIASRAATAGKPFDLLIIHGLYGQAWNSYLMKRTRARRKIVYLWNRSSHRRAAAGTDPGFSASVASMLEQADLVLATWETTVSDFVRHFPEHAGKTACLPWGLGEQVLSAEPAPPTATSRWLLEGISPEDRLIFWPRSFQRNNRHDVLLGAMALLPGLIGRENAGRARLILLGGTIHDEHVESILGLARSLSPGSVRIERGRFFNKEDILPVYDRADLVANLVDDDQMGACVMEGIARRCALLLSDIEPYRLLERKGFEVAYCRNTPEDAARSIIDLLDWVSKPEAAPVLEANRLRAIELYSADTALQRIIDYCLSPGPGPGSAVAEGVAAAPEEAEA